MHGKKIVVIGGSHGIGFGIVERCVASGAEVTVVSRTMGQLSGLSVSAHLQCDVTQDDIESKSLPDVIDGFVYCPGSINLAPLRGTKPEVMREDFELNVIGALKCLQAALPGLKESGAASAVFFSTVAVAQGLPMHTSIAAAKGAIEALVRSWAAELSPRIRVNAIAPALTDTPLAAKILSSDEKRELMGSKYPLGRVGTIEDMAAAAVFLLSSESGWITGQVLGVDGGMATVRKQ